MPIVQWGPGPFRDIQRFFEEEGGPLSALQRVGWDLAIDLYEEKGNIIAKMSLPGINPDNIDIQIEDSYLKISGSREEEEKNYYYQEIRRGDFERTVKLPTTVLKDKASAEYENGVLMITIPIVEEKKAKKIKIAKK
ncbi:MAG: Hsp20/alpha crystallin family protein [Patescibacteria group bacterium]|nr:Hsp20/alpha crystallin family protein [Patescibacteria group bacterium]